MKKLFKNTGKLLLSAATLVIVLHLLIPHDHHQESLCFHTGNHMPVHEHSKNHPVFPSHCHAFNDVDAREKNLNVSKLVSLASLTAIIEETSSTDFTSLFSDNYCITDLSELKSPYISSPLLRAPPVIS